MSGTARIVVVEDDAAVAELVTLYLRNAGFIVEHAPNGARARALFDEVRPALVVLDLGLPDGDGVEVARQLIAGGCPVVLFTSHTRQELVDRVRSAGVMSYLLKPLRAAELAPVLDLAVARFSETRDLRRSLEERKIIERAKGRLMARYQLSEDDAFRRLRRAAMDSRRPMVDIARALLVSETVAKP